jgi:RNA polymerase sigma factor (TIGR02999 family)
MRRVLVEHARARRRKKRGGDRRDDQRLTLSAIAGPPSADPIDLLALDASLEHLSEKDPRKTRVVELLYFGGLSAAEAAEVLGVTSRTVERDWAYARAWLLRELQAGPLASRPPASRRPASPQRSPSRKPCAPPTGSSSGR